MPLALETVEALLAPHFLEVLGGFDPEPDEEGFPEGTRSLLLLGPKEPGFWPHFTTQPEWDGAPDPMDRGSQRVVGEVAEVLGAVALMPFGGPPWHPFFQWALRTGRAWQSPVKLLVHESQGLMVSFRGALALREPVAVPRGGNPCLTCPAPCLTACPIGALTAKGFDVPACKTYLRTPGGQDCLNGGCLVRRSCPVSQRYGRLPEQSAYHMQRFLG